MELTALYAAAPAGYAVSVASSLQAYTGRAFTLPVVSTGSGALAGLLQLVGLPAKDLLSVLASIDRPETLRRRFPHRSPRSTAHFVHQVEKAILPLGVTLTGHLRRFNSHPIFDFRFDAVVVDVATDRVVVLPRDARSLGLDPDLIPLASLVAAAMATEGVRPPVAIGDRRFASAIDRSFDPGPWFADAPGNYPILSIEVTPPGGPTSPRRFPAGHEVIRVNLPQFPPNPNGKPPTRRQLEVQALIGTERTRHAVAAAKLAKPPGSALAR